MPKSKNRKGVSDADAGAFVTDSIDFSDIPELTGAALANARIRVPVTKEAVSIRLDSDLLQAIKGQGPGYQTRINDILRRQIGLPGIKRNTLRIYKEGGETAVYVRTDEIEELIGALEHCASLASELDEATTWKWLVVALHNAVQGACVCALRGEDSMGISVLTAKSAAAVLKWHQDRSSTKLRKPPSEQLAEMLELFERTKSKEYLSPPHRLSADTSRDDSIGRLNILRNRFVHFIPQGLSLELSGMPKIVEDCADVIEHLSVKHPSYARHLNDFRVARTKTALNGLRNGVASWAKAVGID